MSSSEDRFESDRDWVVESEEAYEEPPEEVEGDDEFEWTEDRDRAIEAALGYLAVHPFARIFSYLRELTAAAERGEAVDLTTADNWLQRQQKQWQGAPRAEDCEPFNEAIEQVLNALGLAREVVAMLRDRDSAPWALMPPLVAQVNDGLMGACELMKGCRPE